MTFLVPTDGSERSEAGPARTPRYAEALEEGVVAVIPDDVVPGGGSS